MKPDFEKFFIELALEKITENNISHSEFARQVFLDRPRGSAERIWRRVRSPDKKGNPRTLTLIESERIGSILSESYATFVWQVDRYMKQKQAE